MYETGFDCNLMSPEHVMAAFASVCVQFHVVPAARLRYRRLLEPSRRIKAVREATPFIVRIRVYFMNDTFSFVIQHPLFNLHTS